MGAMKEYTVTGTLEAEVHCTVMAQSPEAAKRRAKMEGTWWFSDRGDAGDVQVTGVQLERKRQNIRATEC